MKITDEMVERAAREYHECGNGAGSFDRMAEYVQARLLFRIRAALEAALTRPCTCREDVVCGACMSGPTDPATAQSTPPADDVRLEYTIVAESSNGALTQLADYTTVVREHLKADLELYHLEETRAKGSPERIFIGERPIPKWVRS